MSKRARHCTVAVLSVLLAFALTRVADAGGWSKSELSGAAAGLIVVVCLSGGSRVMLAPRQAPRQQPRG